MSRTAREEAEGLSLGEPADCPDAPGVYQLHLRLRKPACIAVGKLGTFIFPAGRYVYTGSALGGLERRLARHRQREKTLRWHIDYLLQVAEIVEIVTIITREQRECAWNRETLAHPGAHVPVPGFGSSDCRCPTHLICLSEPYPMSIQREARCSVGRACLPAEGGHHASAVGRTAPDDRIGVPGEAQEKEPG